MKPLIMFASCLAIAGTVTACSSDSSETAEPVPPVTQTVVVTETQSATTAATEESATLADVYGRILDNPAQIPVSPAADYEPSGEYSYTIAEVTGDSLPDMLLRVESRDLSPVIVITSDKKGGFIASTDVLVDGETTGGGPWYTLHETDAGYGIFEKQGHTGSIQVISRVFQMEGAKLKVIPQQKGNPNSYFPAPIELKWQPSDNRSALTWLEQYPAGDY